LCGDWSSDVCSSDLKRVVHLLKDERLREQTAAEARRLVEECYSWRSIMSDAIERLEGRVKGRQ